MVDNKLIISSSPQWRDNESIPKIMWTVNATLVPIWAFSIYLYGFPAFWITFLAIISAIITEHIITKLLHKPSTISDGSAVVTGILLAFNLPPDVPFWIPIIGSFVAIAIGKQIFGGLGNNPLNPALVGRAFLMASWPVEMTSKWLAPHGGTLSGLTLQGFTGATPLNIYKINLAAIKADTTEINIAATKAINGLYANWQKLFIGNIGGCIGETSALLILLGGLFLIYKKYIDWRVPFTYILTVGFLGWMFGGYQGLFSGNFLFHIFSGGLFLGAFYMLTDMVTSPVTKKGRIIFAAGAGVIAITIRLAGGYPEGVSYSILLMNLVVPLIDRYVKPTKFGEVKNEK